MILENPLLIFDLGNVILRHDNDYWMDQLAGACASPDARKLIWDAVCTNKSSTGQCTVEELFQSIKAPIGFKGDYAAFNDLWCCHFSHDEGMERLVEDLATRYRLVILSNTDNAHWKFVTQRYPVLRKPHALYTSFELGMVKPDAAIYLHVLEAENREPRDAIFIDDRIENVKAARALGINGIHFTGQTALEKDLAALGI